MTRLKFLLTGAAAIFAMPAQAQLAVDVTDESAADMVIAVPAMPTPESASTPAGTTDALGRQVAEVVDGDLSRSGLFRPLGPGAVRAITFPEVTAPAFDYWPGTGAVALVQGFVRANSDGKLTVGCYLYDVALKSELTRQGYVVEPRDWRRAAHKCADAIYSRLSGESPFFDSRIAYIAESGPKDKRVKRLAIMDSDGANHRFLTNGQSVVLTPRFSPDYKQIVYLSYVENKPRIYIYDIGTGRQRLVTESVHQTFAPRFSPDGRFILYSMSVNGNMDIYRISANGGTPQRLTNSPGIDGRVAHRLRKRPFRQPAALRDECRRFEPAPHQLRRRQLRHSRMEPARRSHRLYPRRQLPHRRDDSGGLRRAAAHQQLAGRIAKLVAQRPRHPVFQDDSGARRQVQRLAGRPDRHQ